MSTSLDFTLCEPSGDDKIDTATYSYMRARNRHRLFSLIIKEFDRSGVTQAELARRLGKKPDVVCRWLSGPGNLQLDTISDLLFAISGAEADYSIAYPLRRPSRNDTKPNWLIGDQLAHKQSGPSGQENGQNERANMVGLGGSTIWDVAKHPSENQKSEERTSLKRFAVL